jgi:hypothetical protein
MKIAVYGDSFAQPVEFGYKGNDFLWCNTLANKLNGSIDNFAKTGTSIFYSYQKFLSNYNDYDLCIFVVTEPNRYFKRLKFASGVARTIGNIDQLEFYRKTLNLNAEDKQTLTWLEGWFLSSDPDYNKCFGNLMINDIINKKPNTVVYPGFPASSLDTNLIPLHEMHRIQLIKMGKDMNDTHNFLYNENWHKIAGHFTESFNNFISEMLFNKIKHGIDYDFSKLHEIEIDKTIDYYDYIDKTKDCPK